MAIKTREFLGNTYYDNIDNSINEFLSLSQVEEVIDIKYQNVAFEERGETIVLSSALVIYKEEEE